MTGERRRLISMGKNRVPFIAECRVVKQATSSRGKVKTFVHFTNVSSHKIETRTPTGGWSLRMADGAPLSGRCLLTRWQGAPLA